MMILYRIVCVGVLGFGALVTAVMFSLAGKEGPIACIIGGVFAVVFCGIAYGLYRLDLILSLRWKHMLGNMRTQKVARLAKEPAESRPRRQWKKRSALQIAAAVLCLLSALICLVLGDMCGRWYSDYQSRWGYFAMSAVFVCGMIYNLVLAPEKAKIKADSPIGRWLEQQKQRRNVKPVKAVLIATALGQKNRMVDGMAGDYLFGPVGGLAGFFGGKPKDQAMFYVTWDDGHTSTVKTKIGSPWFLELMALTRDANDA